MKTLIFALLLCSTAEAKEFKFVYHYPYDTNMNRFQVSIDADSWSEAHSKAADQCVDHYLDTVRLDEYSKVEIANVCTNPR